MTPRGRRARPRAIVIFGENENDTKAIREFILALRPDSSIRIEARRRPPINIRDAPQNALPSRIAAIARVIEAEQVNLEVVAVVAHEDCDAVEPSHVALASRIEAAFAAQGINFVRAATPAWETETWLMQWSDAFPIHVPTWRSVAGLNGRNVGMIANAKEHLANLLEQPGGRGREYRESDAPAIASIVRTRGWVRAPRATSNSFTQFAQKIDALPT